MSTQTKKSKNFEGEIRNVKVTA